MKTLHEQHMEMIDAVNNATTESDHYHAMTFLNGWRDGVRAAGMEPNLIEADLEQMEHRGINRPMCCGVFLDWKPSTQPEPTTTPEA